MNMSRIDARTRHIETAAAELLWKCRDTATVETVLSPSSTGRWNGRFVRYDDHVYHPVLAISDDYSSASALIESPDGPTTLRAGHGPLAETWDAVLSWRILKLLIGGDPVSCEWLAVPRTPPSRGREPFWHRLLRSMSPSVLLDDPRDIVRHDLAMRVLKTILDGDLRPYHHGMCYDIGNGVEMRVHGRRFPRYTILHPQDGGVMIPDRLRRTFDKALSEHVLKMARAADFA